MRFTVVILLILSLMAPDGAAFTPPPPAKDCVMCGHACCCPDECASALEELKAKQRAVSGSSCDVKATDCQLSSSGAPVAGVIQVATETAVFPGVLRMAERIHFRPTGRVIGHVLDLSPAFHSRPPVPPPEASADRLTHSI